MQKNTMLNFLLVIASSLLSPSLWAANKVSECNFRPDFLGHLRSTNSRGLDGLPAMVFIGRKAEYYVEDKVQNLKILAQQSFTRAESKILCASKAAGKSDQISHGFSLYAPTLIDLSGEKKIGDSYWQFHLSAEADKIGVWNKKSRVFFHTKDLEAGLRKTGAKYQFYQLSHDEYELILLRETATTLEALSIRFDVVPDVK